MKRVLFFIFITITLVSKSQQWEWAKGIGTSFPVFLQGVQVCPDSKGSFYVSGYNWDQNYGYPAGSVIIKFDPYGNEKWRRTWNDKIRILKIKCDRTGNLLIAGDFMDSINVNGTVLTSHYKTDGFIISMDTNGLVNWFKLIAGSGEDNVQDIHIDAQGNLFITGLFSDKALIAGVTARTQGSGSTYIAKLDPKGSVLKLITANNIDSNGHNYGYRIQTDLSGNIYVLGSFNEVSFGTMSATDGEYYGAQFMSKFDSAGNIILLKDIINGTERFKNFCVSSAGLYFTGDGGWTNGGWTKTEKYDLGGNLQWTKSHSGFYFEYTSNSIVENNNGFYTLGYQGDSNIPSWNYIYSLMISNFDTNGQETCTYVKTSGRRMGMI